MFEPTRFTEYRFRLFRSGRRSLAVQSARRDGRLLARRLRGDSDAAVVFERGAFFYALSVFFAICQSSKIDARGKKRRAFVDFSSNG